VHSHDHAPAAGGQAADRGEGGRRSSGVERDVSPGSGGELGDSPFEASPGRVDGTGAQRLRDAAPRRAGL
jgi:hypothetical protein